jgi:hypothetical protein
MEHYIAELRTGTRAVGLEGNSAALPQALPWAAVYLGCLGGIVGYGAAIFMSARSLAQCPRAAQATPVACAGGASPAAIDWTRLPRDAIKRRHSRSCKLHCKATGTEFAPKLLAKWRLLVWLIIKN